MKDFRNSWFVTPTRGLQAAILLAVWAFATPVVAQPKKKDAAPKVEPKPVPVPTDTKPADGKPELPKKGGGKDGKEKTFDFNALDLNGRMRTPQLLYFLERANEELERASLEKRSFIPHMVRSIEEEPL